jgi:predicted nucleic acid-binding protein
MRAL